MSKFQRVQQWSSLARTWWLYDAQWQNPFQSAKKITRVLQGLHKPIYSPTMDVGDHVVVINSQDVALLGREWQMRVYFHHTGYPKTHYKGGARWIPAWELHSRDPTLVLWKACYNNLYGDIHRKGFMARLHVYPNSEVPDEILCNVSGQIRPVKPVPKKLEEYSPEERQTFPQLWDFPESYTQR
ncbi:hypothetical protein TCAL_00434 [Tigriopus californicus]|uniref:Large ribosomal subunit protein uL13m n=1 Tax=Tigriopus californicus TaxID=6832 RepID=A0A553NDV5_TIGCA|nr:large ribosomal subunit protein uL13m-like [Tigriopus californicus]TRY63611.1 hypothetical protein TCAL_00434 [Tigriopus californicus]|eukprot:TCALIF_00434-PA protein Name:"Similar to mRpL13 39S ribosomal protein L13, mitochondrial (Drosophila melanogaster)" AED:0.02 eAED:0.02 QI:0/-1/0/1/-1/1/1/0/183